MIRLGDGTPTSHQKMQKALDDLWMFSEEPLIKDTIDEEMASAGVGVDLDKIKPLVQSKIRAIAQEATLTLPENTWMQQGGKQGHHSEHLGFILAEMQFLQRAYPGQTW